MKTLRCLTSLCALAMALGSAAQAQTKGSGDAAAFPTKPIRLVAPTSAGGGNDIIARMISAEMSSNWGQQLIVDLRPGAAGIIGSEIAAKAAPDGYTIVIVATVHTMNPSLYAKLPYDTAKDFEPISMVAFSPLVFLVHPAVPAQSIKDLIAMAKAKPGQYNHASAGRGTAGWFSVERFKRMAGIDMTHIPYKGAGDAVASVVSGQVHLLSTGPTAVVQHIKVGRLRALGVTSPKRVEILPDVPAIAETLPGYEEQAYVAILAPAKTPKAILDKLHNEIARIIRLPAVRSRIDALGLVPGDIPRERIAAYLNGELAKASKVFADLGIKPETR